METNITYLNLIYNHEIKIATVIINGWVIHISMKLGELSIVSNFLLAGENVSDIDRTKVYFDMWYYDIYVLLWS